MTLNYDCSRSSKVMVSIGSLLMVSSQTFIVSNIVSLAVFEISDAELITPTARGYKIIIIGSEL